jgi:hypothetical protein
MSMMLLLVAAVLVQPVSDDRWRFDRPVEQGFEDTGILSRSFREPMADLRQAAEWDRVYRMEGDAGAVFARRDGGVTAVFPQSDYVATRSGTVAAVPAGTIYVIGEPAPWLLRQLGLDDGYESLARPGRIDLSLAMTLGGGEATPTDPRVTSDPRAAGDSPAEPEGEPLSALELARRRASMWYNDGVRAGRVSALLSEAARAEER